MNTCPNVAICGAAYDKECPSWQMPAHKNGCQCTDVSMELTDDVTSEDDPCPICLGDDGARTVRFLCRPCGHTICIKCAKRWAWKPRETKPYCMRKFLDLCGWPAGRRANCAEYARIRKMHQACGLGGEVLDAIEVWRRKCGVRRSAFCEACPTASREGTNPRGVCLHLFAGVVLGNPTHAEMWEFVRLRPHPQWYQVSEPPADVVENTNTFRYQSGATGANLHTCAVCRAKSTPVFSYAY